MTAESTGGSSTAAGSGEDGSENVEDGRPVETEVTLPGEDPEGGDDAIPFALAYFEPFGWVPFLAAGLAAGGALLAGAGPGIAGAAAALAGVGTGVWMVLTLSERYGDRPAKD